jgi:RNA polymerase sigma-70 factor (ECF subfamily)
LSGDAISEKYRLHVPRRSVRWHGNTGRFSTTRWSLILSSIDGEGEEGKAREALAQLCRIYWRPIFAFVCRRGSTLEDAQDLTQDFFLMILKGNLLQRANAIGGDSDRSCLQRSRISSSTSRQGARAKAGRRCAVCFLG